MTKRNLDRPLPRFCSLNPGLRLAASSQCGMQCLLCGQCLGVALERRDRRGVRGVGLVLSRDEPYDCLFGREAIVADHNGVELDSADPDLEPPVDGWQRQLFPPWKALQCLLE